MEREYSAFQTKQLVNLTWFGEVSLYTARFSKKKCIVLKQSPGSAK